jgi:DNA-binding GntR family transcriptional regulator
MNMEIYTEIKNRILFFEYEPGEMLNEKAMAAEFGVSRTPVREALLRLEWEKLLTIIPRAGIMVSKVEFHQLREVFQTRTPLEGLMGRLAALQMTDEHLFRMREIKNECEKILTSQDKRSLVEVDMKFREVIHDSANNESLREVSDYLYYQTQRLWFLIFDKTDFDSLVREEIEYMGNSLEVFAQRDPDKAEEFRRGVVYTDLNRVRNIFEYSPQELSRNSKYSV